MRLTAKSATGLLLAAGLLVAGCGGGSSAPTRQEYAKSAGSICNDLERSVKGLGASNDLQDLQRQFADARRKFDQAIAKLADLDRPSGQDGDLADQWIASLQQAQRQFDSGLDDLVAGLKAGDKARIKRASDRIGAIATSKAQDLGSRLGVKSCVG